MMNGIAIRSLDDVERLAKIAVASGYTACKRPEEAAMLIITGHELGLSPAQSLRGIYVVNGRPVLSADLMVAVVRRSGLCESWRTVESTAERCTITTRRKGESTDATRTWTAADAKRAGVSGKGIWQSYPATMLRHRVAADLAREVYPDVLLGLYDPEELGGEPEVEGPVEAPRAVLVELPDDAQRVATAALEARGLASPDPEADDPAEALIRDLRDSAEACTSVAGLASLWQAARTDVAALDERPAQERCWRVLVGRAKALGETITSLKAAIAAQGVAE